MDFLTSYLKESSREEKLIEGGMGFKKEMFHLWNPHAGFFMTDESVCHPLAPIIVFFSAFHKTTV